MTTSSLNKILIAAATLGLAGVVANTWSKDTAAREAEFAAIMKPVTGEVISTEYVNGQELLKNPEYNGLIAQSNETVKVGESKYIINLKTDEGKYISVSVTDENNGAKEALKGLVHIGSRITFPAGNIFARDSLDTITSDNVNILDWNQTYFKPDTQIGMRRAELIHVINNK